MSPVTKSLFFDPSVRQEPYSSDALGPGATHVACELDRWLEAIGSDLDNGIFPKVFNGGVVAPGDYTAPQSSGEEIVDEHKTSVTSGTTQEGPPGTSRASGASGASGASKGPWTASEAASVICRSDHVASEGELAAAYHAYPGIKVWEQEGGLWLLSESSLWCELDRAATFLTFVPRKHGVARGWGFWRYCVGISWIGPRHTNFPDGSICAFSPFDKTWEVGNSIVELLDLYSTWAVRQLYLEKFGRWPGPQIAFHPYERLTEFKLDDLCDCQSGSRYGACCHSKDSSRNMLSDAVNFSLTHAGGLRRVPSEVANAVLLGAGPPLDV